ncbi:alpha/beta fold hydrolase [Antrihabitans sp. NCIMB 15449]|uniref:Alpha/beta fold hydrolase n=1 Tax=Antrihabitans spumae TaxID=3373370 RepID=A0ABW7JX59_9NOCA
MATTSTVTPVVDVLEVPGARLHYEVRGSGPVVALIGAPMNADSFAPIADLLADEFTVLTADPRGINRSQVTDPTQDSTPELRADDLARLLTHINAGPAIVFGSSGGAITALAFAQARPDLARAVIAHEPPLNELLDDRAQLHANTEDMIATYAAGDRVGAWRKFMTAANIALPEEVFMMMFGNEPEPQQAADEARWFAHELLPSTTWVPDLNLLGAVPTTILVGVGAESTGQLCVRTSTALSEAIGAELTSFPGGHTGFADDPTAFAPRLAELLHSILRGG